MTGPTHCSRCGAPLADAAAGPVCPACLLKLGLVLPTAGETVMASPFDASGTMIASPATGEGATVLGAPTPGVVSGRGGATPKQIGPYHLGKTLGEGGMGVVYLAEQTEPIRRTVALKLIKLGMDTHEVVARFEAERQALAMMDHPNIASVLDAGATPDGRPYFVMEYAPGLPITEYCDRQQLTTRQRVELFLDVCAAVQHAHQKGIIHRDLKPSNVLVIDQDGKPVPKVIDFGIAKATEQRLTEKTMFTQHGALIGTPEYMSPEQADPGAVDIDTRTDIYAMGVILYEMLVGALPFSPTRLRQAAYSELLRIIREEEPARPSTRLSGIEAASADAPAQRRTTLPGLSAQLRGDLDWITLKALEKERTRRYASASEFSADLSRYLNNEPIVARPAAMGYRIRKFARRNRLAVTAAGVVAVSLLAGLGVSLNLYVHAERARKGETAQRQVAEQQRAEADTQRIEATRGRQDAEAQRAVADAARTRADAQATIARNALAEAETQLYFNHIDLAEREWSAGNIGRTNQLLADAPTRLRSWEWHYLARLSHMEDASFEAPGPVGQAIAFTPDGTQLITANRDTTLITRNASTGAVVTTIRLMPGRRLFRPVPSVFSADATSFAALSQGDATGPEHAAVWDTATGRERFAFPALTSLTAIDFSADGTRIATASSAGANVFVIKLWRTESGLALGDLANVGGVVSHLAFSPDGRRIAAVGRAFMSVIDVANGQTVLAMPTQDAATTAGRWVQFSGDGNLLFEGNDLHGIRAWSATDGKLVWTYKPESAVRRLTSGSGGTLLAGLADQSFRLVEAATGKEWRRFVGHTDQISAQAFSRASDRFTSASVDRTVRVWTVGQAATATWDAGSTVALQAAAVTPDTQRLLVLAGDRVMMRALPTGRVILEAPSSARLAAAVSLPLGFSADGRTVAYPVQSYRRLENGDILAEVVVSIRDTITGIERPIAEPKGRPGTLLTSLPAGSRPRDIRIVGDLSLDARATRAILTTASGSALTGPTAGPRQITMDLEVWDIENTRAVLNRSIQGQGAGLLSPDGRRLLMFLPAAGVVRLDVYDAVTGRRIREGIQLKDSVPPFVLSPDGALLASSSATNRVTLWDTATWAARPTLAEHNRGVVAMAFSPDGARLITVADDEAVRVFEVSSGRQTLLLRATQGAAETMEVFVSGRPAGFRRLSLGFSDGGAKINLTTITSVPSGFRIYRRTWDGRPRRQ